MTDYKPGDSPVPVGTVVCYKYQDEAGTYTVLEHDDPAQHPYHSVIDAETYPDGVGYYLWPSNAPRKFGNRHLAIGWVRRTSFTIVEEREDDSKPG